MKSHNKISSRFHALPHICYVIILLFVAGFITGSVSSYLFKTSLYAALLDIFQNLLNQLRESSIHQQPVFWFAFKYHFKAYLLLLLFSVTNIWTVYLSFFAVYQGLSNGLLFSFCVLLSGPAGIIQYLCLIFPQILIFLPLYLFILYRSHLFHEQFRHNSYPGDYGPQSSDFPIYQKGQLILHQLPIILISLLLLLLGCFLEGYLNVPLVTWYLSSI